MAKVTGKELHEINSDKIMDALEGVDGLDIIEACRETVTGLMIQRANGRSGGDPRIAECDTLDGLHLLHDGMVNEVRKRFATVRN